MLRKLRIVYLRDLLRELIARDLKVRYQRSVLGIGWSLLKPLSQLLVFLFLFGTVMPLAIPFYATYLLAGVLGWSWFGSAVAAASTSITGNPELVRRPGFPVRILPVLTVMSDGIHYLLALPILLLVGCWEAGPPGASLVALPLVIVVQFLFTLGLAYLVAATHVRFRDTQDAVGILLMLGFYLTPVFYQAKDLHAPYKVISMINPMAQILAAYRTIIIDRGFPDMPSLGLVALVSIVLLAAGIWVFNRSSAGFAEEL